MDDLPIGPLEPIRAEARAAGLVQIYYNEPSRVISFAPCDSESGGLTRLNVYYTTGTVATCLDHPREGQRQLFRRNVDMATLCELMREPRSHTGAGYHRRQRVKLEHSSQPAVPQLIQPLDEEAEARAQLERLYLEVADVGAVIAACVGRRQHMESQVAQRAEVRRLAEARRRENEQQTEAHRVETLRVAEARRQQTEAHRVETLRVAEARRQEDEHLAVLKRQMKDAERQLQEAQVC